MLRCVTLAWQFGNQLAAAAIISYRHKRWWMWLESRKPKQRRIWPRGGKEARAGALARDPKIASGQLRPSWQQKARHPNPGATGMAAATAIEFMAGSPITTQCTGKILGGRSRTPIICWAWTVLTATFQFYVDPIWAAEPPNPQPRHVWSPGLIIVQRANPSCWTHSRVTFYHLG